jgi:hypothetical protein
MGFFDPPHKKMLAKSPRYFQDSAPFWGAALEALIFTNPSLTKGGNLVRAVLVGRLALRTAEEDPANWSSEAVEYIERATRNAELFLPEPCKAMAWEVMRRFINGTTAELGEDSN